MPGPVPEEERKLHQVPTVCQAACQVIAIKAPFIRRLLCAGHSAEVFYRITVNAFIG